MYHHGLEIMIVIILIIVIVTVTVMMMMILIMIIVMMWISINRSYTWHYLAVIFACLTIYYHNHQSFTIWSSSIIIIHHGQLSTMIIINHLSMIIIYLSTMIIIIIIYLSIWHVRISLLLPSDSGYTSHVLIGYRCKPVYRCHEPYHAYLVEISWEWWDDDSDEGDSDGDDGWWI